MSLFGKILDRLGIDKSNKAVQKVQHEIKQVKAEVGQAEHAVEHAARIARIRFIRMERKVQEAFHVDVMSKLEKMAEEYPAKLNWKTSVADLLTLLGIDNSYENRRELATELGCPKDKMDDSAKMNTWLHKAILIELAEHGGNVPDELLD